MGNASRWIAASIALAALAFGREASARTLVTLGFDDGRDSQLRALPLLAAHGMRASFFVNSNNVGAPGYMTWEDLLRVQAAGHELGGHTVDHVVLTQLSEDEARLEACDDRAALEAAGLRPLRSFAYPEGSTNPATSAIVASCGYELGWAQGGIDDKVCHEPCTFAQAIEGADLLELRSPRSVEKDWTLEDLQGFVVRAESAGGWLGLVFHHVCDDCNYTYRITPALLSEFLAWLEPRAANGTVVLPFDEAFGAGAEEPLVPPPARPARPSRTTALELPSHPWPFRLGAPPNPAGEPSDLAH